MMDGLFKHDNQPKADICRGVFFRLGLCFFFDCRAQWDSSTCLSFSAAKNNMNTFLKGEFGGDQQVSNSLRR